MDPATEVAVLLGSILTAAVFVYGIEVWRRYRAKEAYPWRIWL
jgi:hypothetical protein